MDYKVTVYCTAFNHERYIEQALIGFVMQKTNFSFKVIVHDDASTDGTRKIIEKYAEEYPDIIFPIYQRENQYSRGVRLFEEVIQHFVNSKYTAICEGDDYWTDENKLQVQYDYMEKNPDVSLCVHNSLFLNEQIGEKAVFYSEKCDRDYSANDVIAAQGGGLFHTSSFFYRSDDRCSMPDYFKLIIMDDYPLSIYLSTKGKVHYMRFTMSCYRVEVPDSWTQRTLATRENKIQLWNTLINYLENLNIYTDGEYAIGINEALKKNKWNILIAERKYWEIIKDASLRELFWKQTTREKIEFLSRMLIQLIK